MSTKIILKKSNEVLKVPLTSDLVYGELALNFSDGKLYFKNNNDQIDYFKSGELTTATTSTLGGVKIGENINITNDGVISVNTASIANLLDVNLVNIQDNQILVYNSSTSQFENLSINLTGGSANQILVKKSGSDYDYQWEDLNITLPTDQVYTKLIDDVSTTSTLYLGEAVPESLASDPVWRIQKIVFDSSGNVDEVRFAGTGTFTQIWNDRTSLTYL